MSFSCICYAIRQETHNGPIKIGITHNIKDRVSALQNGCAHRLVVLGTWPGSRAIEKEIHRELKEHRMSGEWFQPSRAVIGLISRYVGREVTLGREEPGPLRMTEKIASIRDSVIEYVKKTDYVTFAELENHGLIEPGDMALHSESIENLVYWSGMSEDSVDAMIHAFNSGLLSREPSTVWTYIFDGKSVDLPIMESIPKSMHFQTEHWLPICLRPAAKCAPPKRNKKTANV